MVIVVLFHDIISEKAAIMVFPPRTENIDSMLQEKHASPLFLNYCLQN